MPFHLTVQHISRLERKSYPFLKELGHGEYGSVVHAERDSIQMALKLSENFETFHSELYILNLLGSHPNIVAHLGAFTDRFIHVIELEYLRGLTLLDFLLTNGPLQEDLAHHYFTQLVSGMLYSHTVAGVAHRDIKAENLMVCGAQLFILDWGMGLEIAPDQCFFEGCGSPDYSAPELYLRKPYRGPEIDVWAMGVVLYAMVTGNFPFTGADSSKIAAAICKGTYKVPYGTSPAFLDLLARMLAKDPRSRITVREIQEHAWISQLWIFGPPRPMRSLEAAVPATTAKKPENPRKSKPHCHRTGFSDSSLSGTSSVAKHYDASLISPPSTSESSLHSLQTLSFDQISSLENADKPDQLKHQHRRRVSLQSIFGRKRTESSTKVPFRG